MTALGHDLRLIRERRERSIADIHQETRIPSRILESIEDGSLFESADLPEIYLRSYVRTIGKALGIPDRILVDALNAHKAGAYGSHLLRDSTPVELDSIPKGALFEGDAPAPAPASLHAEPQGGLTGPPSMQSVDWASKLKTKQGLRLPPWVLWVSGILVVLLVATGFLWGLRILSGPDGRSAAEADAQTEPTEAAASDAPSMGSETEPVQPAAEDSSFDERSAISDAGTPAAGVDSSLPLSAVPPEAEPPTAVPPPAAAQAAPTADPARPVRPAPTQSPAAEPIRILIHAAGSPLNGLQISSDLLQGTRSLNLEQGQAVGFQVGESLELAGPTGRLTLYVNGRIVQDLNTLYFDRTTRKVILPRSVLEALAGGAGAPDLGFPAEAAPPDSIITLP